MSRTCSSRRGGGACRPRRQALRHRRVVARSRQRAASVEDRGSGWTRHLDQPATPGIGNIIRARPSRRMRHHRRDASTASRRYPVDREGHAARLVETTSTLADIPCLADGLRMREFTHSAITTDRSRSVARRAAPRQREGDVLVPRGGPIPDDVDHERLEAMTAAQPSPPTRSASPVRWLPRGAVRDPRSAGAAPARSGNRSKRNRGARSAVLPPPTEPPRHQRRLRRGSTCARVGRLYASTTSDQAGQGRGDRDSAGAHPGPPVRTPSRRRREPGDDHSTAARAAPAWGSPSRLARRGIRLAQPTTRRRASSRRLRTRPRSTRISPRPMEGAAAVRQAVPRARPSGSVIDGRFVPAAHSPACKLLEGM